MSTIYPNDAIYVLNGDKETNLQNVNTLLDRLGYSKEQSELMMDELEDSEAKYNPQNGDLITSDYENYDELTGPVSKMVENPPFEDLPITILTQIDNKDAIGDEYYKSYNFVAPDESNSYHAIQVIIDNADAVDVNKFSPDTAHVIREIDAQDDFEIYKSNKDLLNDLIKYANDIDDDNDVGTMMIVGLAQDIPVVKDDLESFVQSGYSDNPADGYKPQDNDAVNNAVDYLTSDKASPDQKSFYIWNLHADDDYGSYTLNYGGSYSHLFTKIYDFPPSLDDNGEREKLSPAGQKYYDKGHEFFEEQAKKLESEVNVADEVEKIDFDGIEDQSDSKTL